MAKKKTPEAPPEQAPEPAAPPVEKITQREAVEKAIAAGKGSPVDGVAYVKEQFGITLGNAAFSTLKSQLKKASNPSPKKADRASESPKPALRATDSGPPGVALQVEAIKSLVEMLGANQVISIARLFEK
ncbi:hypothetical protein [Limnoglobus roseus]|uniref:Uncharacterized protein n=1 Tax=Limnoglobus roseus TaxID=2598579 RepID=A0A5C1A9D5_9BACT|nr:hypothetical protein [Limnoglobus roseus]QEL14813.1 hypothetical protein PX52LOC_01710 [Limnoglobus roseus]